MILTRLLSRRYAPLALILAGAVLFYALGAAFLAHAAHADPVVPGTLPETGGGHGLAFYLALGLGALAGVRAIVTSLLDFFTWLAPKTKTTVDDTIRRDLQLAHDKLDALAGLVGELVPAKPAVASGTIGGAA